MILCEWDAPEGNPEMLRTPVCFRILSFSISIFFVWCYSSVSISVVRINDIYDIFGLDEGVVGSGMGLFS